MEPSSGTEPQPETATTRPPGLELGNGLAIFSLVFLVFLFAFNFFAAQRIIALTPGLAGKGLALSTLQDPLFEQGALELGEDGDVVSYAYLFAGGIDLLVLLGFCWWWKKGRTAQFLGLRPPSWRPLLAWAGLFLATMATLSLLEYVLPDWDDPSERIIRSAGNMPLLVLGLAVVPALFEEFTLRGLLFGTLRHVLDKHVSVAITAGLFALIHLQYPWFILLFAVLPLGVVLGYARANTGSIWTSVALHVMNNLLTIALPSWL